MSQVLPPGKFEVDNREIRELLNNLAHKIGDQMPKGWGFTLLLFEFMPGDSLFYISSAQRPDMIATMREFIQRNTKQ